MGGAVDGPRPGARFEVGSDPGDQPVLDEDIRAALYDNDPRPQVLPFIYGLGGRDIYPDNIEQAFAVLDETARSGKKAGAARRYLNLRED